MKRLCAQEYLNQLDINCSDLGTKIFESIDDLLSQTEEMVRLLLNGKKLSHFDLIDSLLTLAVHYPEANALDVMRRMFAFDKADNPMLCHDVWHSIEHIIKHYHQFVLIQKNLARLDINDTQLAGIKIAINSICAEIVTQRIIPNLARPLMPSEVSSFQDTIANQILNEVDNFQQNFNFEAIFRSMMRGSIHVFTHRLFNKPLFCPNIKINTALAEFNLHFERKPNIADHSEARIRFQFVQKQTQKYASRIYTKQEIHAAKLIQKEWRRVKSVRVNHKNGAHSDLAHHMVALETNLRKSVDVRKIREFVELMKTDEWHKDALFSNAQFHEVAVSAMLSDKITTLQLATLLRWHAAKDNENRVETFSILSIKDTGAPKSPQQKCDAIVKVGALCKDLENVLSAVKLDFSFITDEFVMEAQQACNELKGKQEVKALIAYYEKFINQMADDSFLQDMKFVEGFDSLMGMVAVNQDKISLQKAMAIERWVSGVRKKRSDLAEQLDKESDQIFSQYENSAPLSEQAKQHLVPWLLGRGGEDDRRIKLLTYQEIERFSGLVAELPPSERIFYVVHLKSKLEFFKNEIRIEMSQSALQAYRMVAYGEKAVKSDIRFGKFTKEHIEEGERYSMRVGSVATKDSFATNNVHDATVIQYEADNHDDFHSAMLSMLPEKSRTAIFAVADVIRSVSGYQWSVALWGIVDFVFQQQEAFEEEKYNSEKHSLSEIFCQLINKDLELFLKQEKGKPKSLLWALALDIVHYPQKWLEMGIRKDLLSGSLQYCVDKVEEYYSYIRGCDTHTAIYKLSCFSEINNSEYIREMNATIDCAIKQKELFFGFTRRNQHKPALLSLTVNEQMFDQLTDPREILYSLRLVETSRFDDPPSDEVYIFLGLHRRNDQQKQMTKLLSASNHYAYFNVEDLLQDLSLPQSKKVWSHFQSFDYPVIIKIKLPKSYLSNSQASMRKFKIGHWEKALLPENIQTIFELNPFVTSDSSKNQSFVCHVGVMVESLNRNKKNEQAINGYCGLQRGFF